MCPISNKWFLWRLCAISNKSQDNFGGRWSPTHHDHYGGHAGVPTHHDHYGGHAGVPTHHDHYGGHAGVPTHIDHFDAHGATTSPENLDKQPSKKFYNELNLNINSFNAIDLDNMAKYNNSMSLDYQLIYQEGKQGNGL